MTGSKERISLTKDSRRPAKRVTPVVLEKSSVTSTPMVTITIPNEVLPSWNQLYAGSGHWGPRKRMADKWHDLVGWAVLEQKIGKVGYQGRTMEIGVKCFYPKRGHVLDPDNMCIKLAIDGLKGLVIEDDSWVHIRKVSSSSTHDAENPRTEITISWI